MLGAIPTALNATATRLLPFQAYMTSSTIALAGRKLAFADAGARQNTGSGRNRDFVIII